MQEIYLDNATRCRPSPQGIAAALPFLHEQWGTPTAPHKKGQELFPTLKKSYEAIYSLLGAKEEDTFILTSSSAEGINQIIESVYSLITKEKGKNGFLTSNIDEAPTILAFDRLQEKGCAPSMIEVDNQGKISTKAIVEAITPHTALLSLSWANGLTGVIQPITEIGDICRERGILFHLDISHSLGKIFLSLNDVHIDYLTFSGDAIGGLPGTGGLWARQGAPLRPLIVGGGEQAGLRAGSWNIPGLVALATVAEDLQKKQDFFCTEIARLRNRLENGIAAAYPNAIPLFQEQDRLPHITAIAFPGVANEALQYALDKKRVYTNIGGGTTQQIGLVLSASGVEPSLAQTALSFSLSSNTTEEEIDEAVNHIAQEAVRLRSYSHHCLATSKGIHQ